MIDAKGAMRNSFKAWAENEGNDMATTHNGLSHIWLSPMTADLWNAWQAATHSNHLEIDRLNGELEFLKLHSAIHIETILQLSKPQYWADEEETYDSVGDYMDNAQPDAGETFTLTPCKNFDRVEFRCIQVGDSFDYERVNKVAP